jgi:hypothetical protein
MPSRAAYGIFVRFLLPANYSLIQENQATAPVFFIVVVGSATQCHQLLIF